MKNDEWWWSRRDDDKILSMMYGVWCEGRQSKMSLPGALDTKGPSAVQTVLFRYAALQISTHLTVFAAVLLFDDATSGT